MNFKFQPLLFAGFTSDLSGAPYWADPVATEANLPVPDINGATRVVLSTDHIYTFDATTSKWIDTGLNLAAAFGSTPNAAGLSNNSVTVGDITKQYLQMQPANATNPGGVSTGAQDIAGNKTFKNTVVVEGTTYTNSLDARNLSDTLAIGATNASVINIGTSGTTINLIGTTNNNNVTNLNITDKNITINDGGAVGSGSDSGLEVEENALITGYVKTSADRNSWRVKSPNRSGEILLNPNNNGFNNVISSNVLTATRTYTLPDITGDFVLSEGNQTINGNKTLSGTTNLSSLTASTPLKLDASRNVISSDIDLTTDVTAVLPVSNGGTNSSAALLNNRIIQSSAGAIVEASAITANRALISNVNGIPTHSVTTDTELSYVNGVTSSIQTQLNNKQPLDSTLTALAAYNTNGLLTQTAADTFVGRTLTAANTSVIVTNGDGVAGNPTINLDSTLVSLAGFNSNGILVQTALDTFVSRSIVAGNGVSVSNGDGVSANPTITATNFSVGDIILTSFAGANNQAIASDVTGLAFANGSIRAFNAIVSVSVDATSDLFEVFELKGVQRGADWSMSSQSTGDASGVIFSITNAGQIQYQSSNYAGFVSLTIKFRAEITTV